jgi:hypothetical protein
VISIYGVWRFIPFGVSMDFDIWWGMWWCIFRFAVICSNFVLGRLCLFQYFGGVYIIF